MYEAASEAGLDTDRLSFTGCFQILKCRLPECDSSTPGRFERGTGGCCEMQRATDDEAAVTGSIPGVKRKMSKFKKNDLASHLPPLEPSNVMLR